MYIPMNLHACVLLHTCAHACAFMNDECLAMLQRAKVEGAGGDVSVLTMHMFMSTRMGAKNA